MNMRSYQKKAARDLIEKYTRKLPSFKWGRETFYIDTHHRYNNGGLVVQILDEKLMVVITLSTNLPGKTDLLEPGEFYAKTWSENQDAAAAALESGLFEDTGIRIPTGFVMAQLWRTKFE